MPTVTRKHIQIYYKVAGKGRPVVLGHSFLCSGKMWEPQLAPLARSNRVINIDLRGHGRSGQVKQPFDLYDLVDDVTAVLDDLEIDRAVWAGLSIGGMVALRAALAERERVAGLILLDTNAGAETAFKKIKYLAMVEAARIFGTTPLVPQIARMFFCRQTHESNPELVKEWKEIIGSVPFSTVFHTATALRKRDSIINQIRNIEVPSLVMAGEFDIPTPPVCARQIAENLPNASLVEIANAGHLSNLEQPATVTSAMLSYIDDLGW